MTESGRRRTVFAPLIGVIWRTLESYGIRPEEVIPQRLYRPGVRGDSARRVSLDEYFELLAAAAQRVDDPAVGLRSAELLHPSHLGALGYAFMASATLREAIERTARYHRMLNDSVLLDVSTEEGTLKAAYRFDPPSEIPGPQADSILASLLNLCRLNFGRQLEPAAVRMRRARPADTKPWLDVFGKSLEFNAEEDAMLLRREDVDRQLTVANPALLEIHEDVLRRHLARIDREDVPNRARVAIMDALPTGEVSEDLVAARLGMTPRTLYNHLKERGFSFRTLLSELRMELAERYLVDPAYNMTDIAFLLGYSDSSSFTRAFRESYGVPPSRWREARAAGVDIVRAPHRC